MSRFAVMLSGNDIRDLRDTARRIEELGYESVWIPEFHNADGFVRMAAVATSTSQLVIASGIVNAFNRAPAMIAAAAYDLDELSDGRLILGLGTGTRRMQETWYGIEFKPPAPRAKELIELLRALWDAHKGGPFTFSGRFYDVNIQTYGRSRPRRERVPVYLAAVNKIMVRTAGEVADGLVGHPLYSMDWIREAVVPALEDGARRADRPRDAVTFASFIITSVSNDHEEAVRNAKLQVGFYATTRTYAPILALSGWEELQDSIRSAFVQGDLAALLKAVPDEMVDAIAVAGTPDECREKMTRYEGLVDLPVLYPPGFGLAREDAERARSAMIETFASR